MKQSENEVEKAVIDFMQSKGWRVTRNHVGIFRTMAGNKISIGETGFPDWTFTRSLRNVSLQLPSATQLLHVETKATGEKPRKVQAEKIAALNYLGELATWTDNIKAFQIWYDERFR